MLNLLLDIVKKNKLAILFFSFFISCFVLNIANVPPLPRFSGDAVSRVLPALAPLLKLGSPYKDFWEIAPPGVLLLFYSWAKLFGPAILSFRILQLLVSFGVGILIYLILRKVFSSFYALIVGLLMIGVLLSPNDFSNLKGVFLSIELYGLFFSLTGLLIVMNHSRPESKFFFSAFFLTLASQMKDPFGPAIIAVIPPLIYLWISKGSKSFFKVSIYIVLGFFSSLIMMGIYLQILGSLSSYHEVLNAKASGFGIFIWQDFDKYLNKFVYTFQHIKDIVSYSQFEVFPLLWLWFISLLTAFFAIQKWPQIKSTRNKNSYEIIVQTKKLTVSSHTFDIVTVLIYSIGSFMGFTMDGKMDYHYLIQVIPPIFFFWSIITKSTINNFSIIFKNPKIHILLFPALILILLPKPYYLKGYLLGGYNPINIVRQAYQNIISPEGDTTFEKYISSRVDQGSCILSVYGWGVGETYFYSQRKSCTRFFLVNIVNRKWQTTEYQKSILSNPPGAIIYTHDGADMGFAGFERDVINLKQIIDHCYDQDYLFVDHYETHQNIYFPRYSGNELKKCIQIN